MDKAADAAREAEPAAQRKPMAARGEALGAAQLARARAPAAPVDTLLAAWTEGDPAWQWQGPGAAAPEPATAAQRQQLLQRLAPLAGRWLAVPEGATPAPDAELDTRIWQGQRLAARWRVEADAVLWVDSAGRAWRATPRP